MKKMWVTMKGEAIKGVYEMIKLIGDDPMREGLLETPRRVVNSWEHIYGGYKMRPEDVLNTQFKSNEYEEMVLLKDIEFYSTCEHHMLPFFGKAHIGYVPDGKIVGISKLARLVEVFARRLQIQERLTSQIADSLMDILKPQGCGVVIEAKHFCMVCRGVEKQHSSMSTSAIRGVFWKPEARAEFLSMIKS